MSDNTVNISTKDENLIELNITNMNSSLQLGFETSLDSMLDAHNKDLSAHYVVFDKDRAEYKTLLSQKVDKVDSKGLSTNDFTNDLKQNYDIAAKKSHEHTNLDSLNSVSGVNTGDETSLSITNKLGFIPLNQALSNLSSEGINYLRRTCVSYPITGDGIGQIYHSTGTLSQAAYAPSGGTWLVLDACQINGSSAAAYRYGGMVVNYPGAIVAGGTKIINAQDNYLPEVCLWRIA